MTAPMAAALTGPGTAESESDASRKRRINRLYPTPSSDTRPPNTTNTGSAVRITAASQAARNVAGAQPHGHGPGLRLAITDDHQSVRGAGQPDVEPLAAAVTSAVLVQAEHECAAFHALEAQHVAVEHVLVRPGLIPIASEAKRFLPFLLHGCGHPG